MYMNKRRLKKRKETFGQRVKQYFISCAATCSIHGIPHIARKNVSVFERLIWCLLVLSACGWCVQLALDAWDRFETRPTVISLERNHWKWDTGFPSVTICLDEIDEDIQENIQAILNITKDINQKDFVTFLTALVTADFSLIDFQKYANDPFYQDSEKYMEWVLGAHGRQLEDVYKIVVTQTFGRQRRFEAYFTEFGLCHAYNSIVAIYNTPEYWSKRPKELLNSWSDVTMVNPNINKPSVNVVGLWSGFKIFFHGPSEIPSLASKFMYVGSSQNTELFLTVEYIYPDPDIHDLSIKQRQCRLLTESNLKTSPAYTFNLCKIECRIHYILTKCGCTPYYYKRLDQEPICNVTGMECVYHLDVTHETDDFKCPCIQSCIEATFVLTDVDSEYLFLGSSLRWGFSMYPTVRYKRSLIFSSTNLLVQIGGVAGLFLGFCLLGLSELIYFLTLRFYWEIIRGRTIN